MSLKDALSKHDGDTSQKWLDKHPNRKELCDYWREFRSGETPFQFASTLHRAIKQIVKDIPADTQTFTSQLDEWLANEKRIKSKARTTARRRKRE